MPETQELRRGDPCPVCGSELMPARRLSEAEFRRMFDRENPEAVPPFTDTMAPDQIAEHGELYLCTRCRYKARFGGDGRDQAGTSADARSRGASGGAGAAASADVRRELEQLRRRNAELERQIQDSASTRSSSA